MRSFESNETVSLPLSKGGLGLRSAVRSRVAPASCRHHVAGVQRRSSNHQFERCERVRHVSCGGRLRVAHLIGSGRWSPPSNSNGHGRPISAEARVAAFRVGHGGRTPFARDTSHVAPQRVLVGSQGGPLSARPFVCCLTSRFTKFQPQSFRILLRRRLHLPLPLSSSKPDRVGACCTILEEELRVHAYPHPFGEDKGVEPSRIE